MAPSPQVVDERAVRARLGVPASATEVVVVTESSHWDPNWLLSSDRYYRLCVRPALDRALDELAAEPRRVYGLECVFFVERYWHDRPHRRAQFRDLVEQGRLRFTGSGVTTPDTLLPEDELLLRDLLVGQEWLRARGMTQEPRLLYLPDSFGHSPGVPALLRAAGVEYAAVCRIDGMRFPGADMEPAANFPRPGSSAARLIEAGTADFVWRAPDGSEVLTHWMAHGYGHGDMIASGGISRVMGLPASWPDRRPDHVDRRVEEYLAALRPLAPTPYRLLAIGFDFVRPVPRLVDLLDAWNERHHDATGTWLVNAGLDDHLDLVAAHRDRLPTIDLDPNPYWMGFYATRPDLKDQARDLGRRLLATDGAAAVASLTGADPDLAAPRSAAAWWVATTSNHHDFVTGTAPDRVARGEQARWLRDAARATPWPRPAAAPVGRADGPSAPARGGACEVRRDGRLVRVVAPWGVATFDPDRGGTLVGLTGPDDAELLAGPTFELVGYAESGGLWRMGQELHGGRWAEADRTGRHPADIEVEILAGTAHLTVRTTLDRRPVTLRHLLRPEAPTVVTRTSVPAPARRTVTLVTRPPGPATSVTMHQPGGVVARPLRRWYDPTFWPLHSFASTVAGREGQPPGGVVVATATPTGVHVAPDGTVEVVVARTAVKEVAFGVVPVMAPAWGLRWGPQQAVVAVGWPRSAGPAAALALGRRLTGVVDEVAGRPRPDLPVRVEGAAGADLEVVALKPADRGEGTIVRLRDWALDGGGRTVMLAVDPVLGIEVEAAVLVDSLERDGSPLAVVGPRVEVPIVGHLTSVRLLTRPRRDRLGA